MAKPARKTKLAKIESDVEGIWKEIKHLSNQSVKQESYVKKKMNKMERLHKEFLTDLAEKVTESHLHTKRSAKAVNKFQRRVVDFSKKASNVEKSHVDAKNSIVELEDTARVFVKRFDEINNKTNAHIGKLADLMTQVEEIETKIAALEGAPDKLNLVKDKILKHDARLQEVREALDSINQFRNKHGRTIILD